MKDLRGSASADAHAEPTQCLDLLEDVEAYPRWYPDVRKVDVLERDERGVARRVDAVLRAAVGPINRDLDLVLAITREGDVVRLTRVPSDPADSERFDVTWRVSVGQAGLSHIDLVLEATLDVPRLVPLGGVGDSIASNFVGAAARELDAGSE